MEPAPATHPQPPTPARPAGDPSGTAAGRPGPRRRWFHSLSPRTGLQGKLVLCFMFLLLAALGSSCWLFVSETNDVMERVADKQATELGRTLALASETPLERGDTAELDRLGTGLMKSRGIAAVAFFSARGRLLAVATHDPDLDRSAAGVFASPQSDGQLMELQHGWLPSLGPYARLTTPVVRLQPATAAGAALGAAQTAATPTTAPTATARASNRLVGYVTVWVSQGDTDFRARNIQLTVLLIGAVAVLVSLPVMYGMVHRIFHPIRQLVAATDKIAAGDLGARVDIDRPDVIGTLSRSFNEMVNRVKRQQDDLAEANGKLAAANVELAAANAQLERANGKLAESNRDLEEKVRRRTAELEASAGKLSAANGRLSREIAEKEDFLRAVSHDLNAPLRNISGMATMLLMKHRSTFDEDVVHRLERIQKNVQVQTDLIAELLELSRIKTRRQRMERVDLGAMVGELGEVFAQDLETRQIRLVMDTPLPDVTCERARFRQVFQNLIDNAIKYMGDGSAADKAEQGGEGAGGRTKEIHVGCTPAAGGAGGAEFYVRDTGIGIEADDLDKVFCVFRRGKNQAVQNVAGKGVGLASVKSIIETYDGTIRVESRVGTGSTFRFTIDCKYFDLDASAGDAGDEVSRAA